MSDQLSSSNHQVGWAELDRYLAGEATHEEATAVDRALVVSGQSISLAQVIVDQLRPAEATPFDRATHWNTLSSAMRAATASVQSSVNPSRRSRGPWTGLVALGAVCALALATFLGWRTIQHRHATGSTPVRSYATRVAEQAMVTLADGTQIRLAPKTTLTVSRDFGRGDRTVSLTGEAFFDVQPTQSVPFIVRTGSVSTHVLGTQFSVRRYATTDPAEVVVTSGKVASAGHGKSITLTAGKQGRITDSSAVVLNTGDAHSYTDWPRGQLVFENETVSTVLAAVGRWYGYSFRLTDSALASQRISVTFKVADPADMLKALKGTLDVTMSFGDSVVTLHPIRVPSRSMPDTRNVFKPSVERGR